MGKKYDFDYQVGDLLFTKGRQGVIFKFIREVSKGKFAHAEMILGKFKYDEKDRITISSNTIYGTHMENLDRYKSGGVSFEIFRLKGGLTPDQKKNIFLGAKKCFHEGYDYFGAFDNIPWIGWLRRIPYFGEFFQNQKGKLYCSESVRKYYQEIGIELYPQNVVNVMPQQLSESLLLEKVFDTDC